MAWFLRAIERPDGLWACARGGIQLDAHEDLNEAVKHLHVIGSRLGPFEVYLHPLDGTVTRLGDRDS